MYKLRFNLSNNEFFMMWKLTKIQGKGKTRKEILIGYFCPYETSFICFNSTLCNQKGTAKKIHEKETNKTVCSWIKAEKIEIVSKLEKGTLKNKVSYNPHVLPFWFDSNKKDIDKSKHDILFTSQKHVYKSDKNIQLSLF